MIIAIAGVKGSGKTTASEVFINRGFILINFADMLKEYLMENYGFSYEEMYDPSLKEVPDARGRIPRQFMQEHADIIKKKCGDSVFVDHVVSVIQKNPGNYIIGDLRYHSEFDKLAHAGAVFIYIDRKVDENHLSNHSSEQEVKELRKKCNHMIKNDGSRAGFLNNIAILAESVDRGNSTN